MMLAAVSTGFVPIVYRLSIKWIVGAIPRVAAPTRVLKHRRLCS